MKQKKPIQDEINDFLHFWDCPKMNEFFEDVMPIIELYHVEKDNDWIEKEFGDDEARVIRLIRTAYLVSRFAEKHNSKLSFIKIYFKDLYKRMEKEGAIEINE